MYPTFNWQICGRRRRRREEAESLVSSPVASGNAVISAGPIITRSGMNVNLNEARSTAVSEAIAFLSIPISYDPNMG